jgi:hypothetical protein
LPVNKTFLLLLAQEQTFTFHLTPQQTTAIANSSYRNELGRPEYRHQIQMRFSLLETSCEQECVFTTVK